MRYPNWIFLAILSSCFNYSFAASSAQGVVVSEKQIASQVGTAIMQEGGNAVDAAVAVGYALAVVDPCCGNIGGGGFMTIRFANGKETVFNFREQAPHRATEKMFLDQHGKPLPEQSVKGYLAVAVPGTVLGLDTALQKYGRLPRTKVMAPAIMLAENGFVITDYQAKQFEAYLTAFKQQPNVSAIFLNNGKPWPVGHRLVQKNLAASLRLIAQRGARAFYNGPIAKAIVEASNQHGGLLSLEDFQKYFVEETAPIHCQFRGYNIIAPPPPSSGVSLCEMLNIMSALPVSHSSVETANDVRDKIETMRYAFMDRNLKLGDPNFHTNPVNELLSTDYAKRLAAIIKQSNSPPNHPQIIFHKELTDTTHYSVVDKMGNAVSVTYTLNGFFGAQVIAGNTGFFLNDEMDDFSTAPGVPNKFGLVHSNANNIQPGKRPYSSMTPIIVTKNNQLYLIAGSPGGPRIISSLFLTLSNLIDSHMSLKDAIDSGRFHYQGIPDFIDMEPQAVPPDLQQQLEQWGYHFQPQTTWGAVEAIIYHFKNKKFEGINDARRPDGGTSYT